jgi:hypothetical protein
MHNDTKVDEWASADTAQMKSPVRKSQNKKKWNKTTGASPTSYSATDDYLTGESPVGKKRTYKIKGAIGKPDL